MLNLPLFDTTEGSISEALDGLPGYTACVNDPPWSDLASSLPSPERVILAWDMNLDHLESLIEGEGDSEYVVGIGGGSALDTAKFISWKTGKPLVQIPTITSVDACFTKDAGIRVDGNVAYLGMVIPDTVVVDIDLIRSAPAHLNRAGIGDILSCQTGLFDWRLASDRGEGVAWDDGLAALGFELLAELDEYAEEVAVVSEEAVRRLVWAYRRIGAACLQASHSRFEEGSEHFLGYAYEFYTGDRQIHGELIAMCVVASASLQGEGQQKAAEIIARSRTRAHPADLGITRAAFDRSLLNLAGYVRRQDLDFSIIDLTPIDRQVADRLWEAVSALPRRPLDEDRTDEMRFTP
ncbi:MAG: iron-containing alcohol dehydrogenase family protein [Acidimicrobiia bacterium]|nr:iron-containing alcohol dehydrogenase family protein [Acidimicrobiia bacterium]